jgi:hypothetical protein
MKNIKKSNAQRVEENRIRRKKRRLDEEQREQLKVANVKESAKSSLVGLFLILTFIVD